MTAEHRLDDAQLHVVVLCDLDQRAGVLWKAGAAEAGTGMQEFRADAVVEPDAARDLLHVGADLFGEIGDLVDEGDLGREERIRGVFDQLGGAPLGEHQRRLVQRQRPVDVAEHLAPALVVGADHDAVGEFEIADRRALAQEFRIGGDHDVGGRIGLADDALDLVAGADRHGRFGDDHGEAVQRRGDLARGGVDIGEIGMAVAAPRRRADRDEHRIGLRDRRLQVGGEAEPPGLDVAGDQRIEARLEDRNLAPLQRVDLAGVLVDAGDVVAEIRKAGAGDQPHIARANHGNPHGSTRLSWLTRPPLKTFAGLMGKAEIGMLLE